MKKLILLVTLVVSSIAGEFEDDMAQCKSGDMRGCHNLGVDYRDAIGTKPDIKKASKYFQIACDGGIAEGCYNIGVEYLNGVTVKQDIDKAKTYFKKACDNNYGMACYVLGF